MYKPGTNPFDPNISDKISFQKVLDSQISEDMIGFGEIALLYNDKRSASVTALNDCQTWVLNGDVFKHIIAANSMRRRDISLESLQQVELFEKLDKYEKMKLIDGLQGQTFSQGEFVFHEGERGDHFYIVDSGEVECLK